MKIKIDPEKSTPKEVDRILQKDSSFGLYYFTISLVDVFFFPDFRSMKMLESEDMDTSWTNFWKKRIKELEKLKIYNKNLWNDILKKCDPFLIPYRKEVLKLQEGLENIYELIGNLIKNIEDDYLVRGGGAPTKKLNILFLVWSHFIKDCSKVHLKILLDLQRWFSKRTRPNIFGEKLSIYFEEEDIEDDNLKRVLIRYRKGESKQINEKVDRYKERFLIPVNNKWLEKGIKEKRRLSMPIIIFTNGEKLTIKDYLYNRAFPEKDYLLNLNEDYPPFICLDFKSLSSKRDSWLWQIKLLKYIDEMEQKLSLSSVIK
jgi:hypothetical protein